MLTALSLLLMGSTSYGAQPSVHSPQSSDAGDPAPPAVAQFEPHEAPRPQATEELTVHAAPRALAQGAVVEDWPAFRGPRGDGRSRETPLDLEFGPEGPPLLWEVARGEGFAGPAVAAGVLVYPHRVGDEVLVEGLESETGRRLWRTAVPCTYSGKYIEDSGPRATPSIAGDTVYVHSVDGRLLALELTTGRVRWQRNTSVEFEVGDDFFGVVSSPLVLGDLLVQNVGAPGGPCVAAFERATGRLAWGLGDLWGPSCASPTLATLGGAQRLLVVAGGESRPPTGGLLVIDPALPAITGRVPFRSRTYTSVNGASPVAIEDTVYLTAAYNVGSAGIAVDAEGATTELWRNRRLGLEFSTPIAHEGRVIAVDGVSGRAGALVAADPASGEELARETLQFEYTVDERRRAASIGAGSLLYADGAFLVLGDRGHLAVARVAEKDGAPAFTITSDASLFEAPEAWTPPVLSRGLLYICQNNPGARGSSGRRLLCYDLRGSRD